MPTATTLDPTSHSGFAGATSSDVTLAVDSGTFNGTDSVVITSDNGSDTILSYYGPAFQVAEPGQLIVTPGNGSNNFKFTILRHSPGISTLTVTNTQGWANPDPLVYTAAANPNVSRPCSLARRKPGRIRRPGVRALK